MKIKSIAKNENIFPVIAVNLSDNTSITLADLISFDIQ